MKTVITIARTFGSGGAEVGRMIASRLGFYYADKAVLSLAAKRLKLAEGELSLREERLKTFWDDVIDVFSLSSVQSGCTVTNLYPVSDQEIFTQESRIIKFLAERQNCVVIGRGGRYIFENNPKAVHVLLHAPLNSRVARVMKVQGLRSKEEALRIINDCDQARTEFRAKMTKEDPFQATNYHLCIDTGGLALEKAADLIIAYMKAKSKA